jgi:hypothetical protein
MPFIEVIHNEKEYHLEEFNETALQNAGIIYSFVTDYNKDLELSSFEELLSIIEKD